MNLSLKTKSLLVIAILFCSYYFINDREVHKFECGDDLSYSIIYNLTVEERSRLLVYINYHCIEKENDQIQLIGLYNELLKSYNITTITFLNSIKPFRSELHYGDHIDRDLFKKSKVCTIGRSKKGYLNRILFNYKYFQCSNVYFNSLVDRSLKKDEINLNSFEMKKWVEVPKDSLIN